MEMVLEESGYTDALRLDKTPTAQTRLENLNPFCKGHHIVKHHGGWTVRDVEGSFGAVEWISPTGRRYIVQPERRVPVFQTQHDGDPPPF